MHQGKLAKFHNVRIREMTEKEIACLMEEATSGRLGTIGEDGPYIIPLAFVFYNKHIYFHCFHKGKKLNNIAHNPRVCFQVDISSDDTLNYRSVIIQGRAERVTDNEEAMNIMEAMTEKYAGKGATKKAMPKTPEALARMIQVYKIVDYKLSSKLSETVKR